LKEVLFPTVFISGASETNHYSDKHLVTTTDTNAIKIKHHLVSRLTG